MEALKKWLFILAAVIFVGSMFAARSISSTFSLFKIFFSKPFPSSTPH